MPFVWFLIKLFNTYYVTTLSMTTINAIYIICVCKYLCANEIYLLWDLHVLIQALSSNDGSFWPPPTGVYSLETFLFISPFQNNTLPFLFNKNPFQIQWKNKCSWVCFPCSLQAGVVYKQGTLNKSSLDIHGTNYFKKRGSTE